MKKINRKNRAKLGQHFLKDENALQKIVSCSNIKQEEVILEIGPGMGALTKHLLKTGAKVIAVEKDASLVSELKKTFTKEIASERFVLIEEDILLFSPHTYIPKDKKYKIVANIPYYITGFILRKFLEEEKQPTDMTLLVQKEVAERIIAKDKKESLLSISVKAFGEPKIISVVKSGAFSPPPKVDSIILKIENISNNIFNTENRNVFFEILKAGFSHKRKLLSSNLKSVLVDPTKKIASCLIKATSRPENLTLENWVCLWKN